MDLLLWLSTSQSDISRASAKMMAVKMKYNVWVHWFWLSVNKISASSEFCKKTYIFLALSPSLCLSPPLLPSLLSVCLSFSFSHTLCLALPTFLSFSLHLYLIHLGARAGESVSVSNSAHKMHFFLFYLQKICWQQHCQEMICLHHIHLLCNPLLHHILFPSWYSHQKGTCMIIHSVHKTWQSEADLQVQK